MRASEAEAREAQRFLWAAGSSLAAELKEDDNVTTEVISGICVEVISGDTIVIAAFSGDGSTENDGDVPVDLGDIYGGRAASPVNVDGAVAVSAKSVAATTGSFEEVKIVFSHIKAPRLGGNSSSGNDINSFGVFFSLS